MKSERNVNYPKMTLILIKKHSLQQSNGLEDTCNVMMKNQVTRRMSNTS